MPVPCRRRQAYDVPSTVSRAAYSRRSPPSPILSFVSLLCSFPSIRRLPRLSRLSPRSLERRSFLPVSVCASGEPLSTSYATRRRSSVDYFSKSSGSRIFKWRLNETGSAVPLSGPLRPCERLLACAELDPGRRSNIPFAAIPLSLSLSHSLSLSLSLSLYPSLLPFPSRPLTSLSRRHRICLSRSRILAADTQIVIFLSLIPRLRRTFPETPS